VIPGHLDWDRLQDIRSKNLPTSERRFLFNFHGRLPINHDYYEQNLVRGSILKLAHHPEVSVGGFTEEYFDIMGSSHFCLIPEGTSSWTNHLYESFFAGCIPFILSDKYVLPFQELIDWQSLSVRWPQDEVEYPMYSYMWSLVHNRKEVIENMKRKVDAAACWFDFWAFDAECSPYRAILLALEQRHRTMPRYLHPSPWIT